MNGVNYTWDNNGNLLNDGVNDYDYDSANRLVSFSNATTTVTYQYNGLGDRLRETVNGNPTTFTMDLNAGLTQALSDGTNTYIYGNGRIAQAAGTSTEYFLGDALGSVRQMTNASDAITYAKAYDPYGVVTSTAGSSQSSYGYTNEYTDSYIKLIYLRSRMYDPTTGRFQTEDTWQGDYNRPLSLNQWNYVEGNPINATDPSGHYTVQLIFGKYVDDYDDQHKTALRWTNQEISMAEKALANIAIAYAKAYNTEAAKRGLLDGCETDLGYELYMDPSTKKIDPFTAFFRIHDGKVTIKKLSSRRTDPQTGQEDNTYAEATGKSSINVYSPGQFDVFRYGKGNESIAIVNYEHLITHEMGHVFDNAIDLKGRHAVPSALAMGNTNIANGFCGPKTTSAITWQWRFNNVDYEYFAEMYMGWAYGCWEANPNDPSSLSVLGQLRSNFMNDHMPVWIYEKVEGK